MNKLNLLSMLQEAGMLFHGSGLLLHRIEPRQAFDVRDNELVADGPPAVFATQHIDYAMFMALINPESCPRGLRASCSCDNGVLSFGASQFTLDQIRDDTAGYMHVLSRDSFTQRGDAEWVSLEPVEPLAIVRVTRADFKPSIEILDHLGSGD